VATLPRRLITAIALLVLLSAYFIMAVRAAAATSPTFDEPAHIVAGQAYWVLGDYRLDPENGNLSQRLIGLPGFVTGARFPSVEQPAWRASDLWTIADQFLYDSGNEADTLVARARMVVALFSVLAGALVFFWSRQLFGDAGAWVSLSLFVFSPTTLANGGLATSDMFAAGFFALAVWALWTLLHRVTIWTVLASLAATSALFLSKMSAPLLVPMALGMAGIRLASSHPVVVAVRAPRREVQGRRTQAAMFAGLALLHAVAVFVVLWAFYGFRYDAFANARGQDAFIDPWPQLLGGIGGPVLHVVEWARRHHVLPEAYVYGVATVGAYSKTRLSFLNGVVAEGGSHWFFPYAALVKTTIPALLLLATLPIWFAARWRSPERGARAGDVRDGLYAIAPLLVLICVYWASAISSHLNIGYRHMLPVLLATMVLAGVCGEPIRRLGRSRRRAHVVAGAGVAALVCWHAIESLRIAPHYLAYVNPIAGGPTRAYTHLVDSSLDWGQDLPALKALLDREGLQSAAHPPVYLSYFGSARAGHHGIDATLLPGFLDRWPPRLPEPLRAGVYCVSATNLQGVYLKYWGRWTEHYESLYQTTLENLRALDATAGDPAARQALFQRTGDEFWERVFHELEELRFARLTAYLRTRAPDGQAGYSILIYRLSDDELRRALFGPLPAS
jgi:hypothetical protein